MTARPIPVSKVERAPNASLFMAILIFPARGPAMADAPTGNSRAYTSARGAADTAPKEERREARIPAHARGFGPVGIGLRRPGCAAPGPATAGRAASVWPAPARRHGSRSLVSRTRRTRAPPPSAAGRACRAGSASLSVLLVRRTPREPPARSRAPPRGAKHPRGRAAPVELEEGQHRDRTAPTPCQA